MPQVIITETAGRGLERCRKFLADKNPVASKRAGNIISYYFDLLSENADIGRPLDDYPEIRELVIEFGRSGYVALYRKENDFIYVLVHLDIKRRLVIPLESFKLN